MASKKKSNIDKKRKKDKISSKALEVEEDLSLQNVIDLGGDQADYELLRKVNDEEDIETGELPCDTPDEINKKELKQMIKELGLESLKVQSNTVDFDGGKPEGNTESKKTKSVSGKTKEPRNKVDPSLNELPKTSEVADVELKLLDKLLVHPAARWYEESLVNASTKKDQNLEKAFLYKINKTAESLLENEGTVYRIEKEKSKSSDLQWLKTMSNSGTLGDKIAALAIQIQESPVHHVKLLDILLGMASKKGRRECLMAIDTLKDLWLVNLLPNGRKLRQFAEAPNKTNQSGRDAWNRKLILWYFEDQLKKRYEAFVKGMERLLHDNLENIRSKMLGIVFELLSEKPEQEKTLLLYLVNKVGDPNRKIASKAGYLLGCLVQKHPNMKLVITQEVERLLYRPNIGLKAQYYAVCFLNQLILTKKESVLASKLITIYFSLFKAFVDKGQVESKMLGGLLSGVNRAFHYVQEDEDIFSEQVNMLFRVVHIAPFNTSVQALMLLFQVMDSRQSVSDRYYQALYTKLLDPQLRMSSKQAMFLNNIYKSLKVDPSLKRIKRLIHRMRTKESEAFVKRLLQVCSTQLPSFICGVLYLLSEIGKVKPAIKGLVSQPEELDEEEHFEDAVDTTEDPEVPNTTQEPEVPNILDKNDGAKAVDRNVHTGHVFINSSSQAHEYRANARNPLYCGAENACLWEVMKLTKHYHPSVSRFAQSLLQSEDITYNGDPLLDFTLMRFLDRFVYKNPKKKVQEHGGSLMQPKAVSTRLSELPVNTAAFLNKSEENVREDEIFFHRYFQRKAEQEKKINKNKKVDEVEEEEEEGEDEDEIDVEEFEDEDTVMDFAREFEKSKTMRPKGKKRNASAEESDEGSDGEDFNYEAMEMSEDELDSASDQEKVSYTDKDYEKALLDNLSSDEFSENENENNTSTKKKRKKLGSTGDLTMFAAAEEFAHLLENTAGGGGGTDDVDMKGTNLKQQQWELSRMRNSSYERKFRDNRNKNPGASFKKRGKQNSGKSGRKNTQGKTNRKRKTI